MRFSVIKSGSRGNCYLIYTKTTAILLDCGVAIKDIRERMQETGVKRIDAVFITHEHIDHTLSLDSVRRHTNAPIYSSDGVTEIFDGVTVWFGGMVGDIEVSMFSSVHDANDPVCYTFTADGRKLSVITDTGEVTDKMFEHIKDSDLLGIEANYDEQMLWEADAYSLELKERIIRTHLSNKQAGEVMRRVLDERDGKWVKGVMLHQSFKTNDAEIAFGTLEEQLKPYRKGLDYTVASASECATVKV